MSETVITDGDSVVIRELSVRGAPAAAVRHGVAQGEDPADVVRKMLDIGGAVLEHGASSSLVQAVIAEIRSEGAMQTRLRKVADRVASKGFRYEEQVQPIIEAAFARHGDIVEATGGTPGIDGRSKRGDFVVDLDPGSIGGRVRHVVIEAKDSPSLKLKGKGGVLSYLQDAMINREAEAGILVCSGDVPALAQHRLRVYPGNRILVRFDKDDADPLALEVACQLARALAAGSLGEDEVSAHRGVLLQRVERLREIIEQASGIRAGAKQAQRGINQVNDAYDRMADEARVVLFELEDRLAE